MELWVTSYNLAKQTFIVSFCLWVYFSKASQTLILFDCLFCQLIESFIFPCRKAIKRKQSEVWRASLKSIMANKKTEQNKRGFKWKQVKGWIIYMRTCTLYSPCKNGVWVKKNCFFIGDHKTNHPLQHLLVICCKKRCHYLFLLYLNEF